MVERDADDWWEVFTVNVKGVYNFVRSVSMPIQSPVICSLSCSWTRHAEQALLTWSEPKDI